MRLVSIVIGVTLLWAPCAAWAAARQTIVVVFSPWLESGQVRADLHVSKRVVGHCWTQSIAASRPDAWRCLTDTTRPEIFDGRTIYVNDLYDPCFSGARDEVACVGNPFDKSVIVMRLSKPNEGPGATMDKRRPPWAVRLANGATCAYFSGASGVVGGMRINYACSNGTSLLGEPDRSSAPWTIYYMKSQRHSSMTQIGIAMAVF